MTEKILTRNFDRADAHTLAVYRETGGYTAWEKARAMEPAAITDEVKKANLRGLGGAGFPTGMKWSFVPKNHTGPVYLVINADEGEPGTFKDRYLLERDPHALIEGMLIAARAIRCALGFVYTPCASPVLAAVISVSAATGRTVAIAIAYAAGSALVLLVLTLGGRRIFERVRRAGRGPALQRALGAIMLITAVAIATNLDVNFDQFVAQHIPDVNATAALECSQTVTGRLHEITGHRSKFVPANGSASCGGSGTSLRAALPGASQATLVAGWLSTPAASPVSSNWPLR